MDQTAGLRVAVTGAAGFIGRAVVERIARGAIGPVADLRLNDVRPIGNASATAIQGSYADRAIRDRLVGTGIDVLFHLASLPGGASERDPALGKQVNLDGSIALLDAVARPEGPIVVYASSIAALGRPSEPVTDATILRPAGSYGTHKAMIELYLADLTRRGVIDGRAIRLAGVVARPRDAYAGFVTAWMSDLFHAALDGRSISVPADPASHVWLQSIDVVADNIVHAAQMSASGLPPQRAWTLPATVVQIGLLLEALARRVGHPVQVDFIGRSTDQPRLDASDALVAGFVSDGNADALVDTVISRLCDDAAWVAARTAIP